MKTPLLIGILLLVSIWSHAQNVNIPDANFKAALIADNLINTNGDGEIQLTEAQNAISIRVVNANVSDVTGLEQFTNLLFLALDTNNLTTLDVSQLTALQSLTCSYNQLTSLDVTNNPALIFLFCGYNGLTSLDVSSNPILSDLNCPNNSLTGLSLLSNNALTTIDCSNNGLTALTLPNNVDTVNTLRCANNQLTRLDASGAARLLVLDASFNNLSQVQLPTTALQIGTNTGRRFWNVAHNQLTALDITITRNFNIDCGNNQLDSLEVTGSGGVFPTVLQCDSNQLVYLDHGPWLDSLYATSNQLTTYAVSGASDLKLVDLSYNSLTTVDLLSSEIRDIKLNNNNIDRLRFDNVNNITSSTFDARNNPNLWCIAFNRAADANYARTAWTNVDNTGVVYSDLNNCFPIWLNVSETKPNKAITIFPNPTIGEVYIDLEQTYPSLVVQVYNSTGQLLQEQILEQVQRHQLTLPEAAGAYWIGIQTPQERRSFVVVKQP